MKHIYKIIGLFICSFWLFTSPYSITGAHPPTIYDAEGIYANSQESVFYVRAFRADGTLRDVGTGFMVNRDGTALTAYHVIGGAERITCVFNDGTIVEDCKVVSQDETNDVAVLKLPLHRNDSGQEAGYPYLNLRENKVKHGEKVFAIGFPLKETKIITEGIVNSPRAPINGRDRILVSAEIVNGMSGGPVLDKYGQVVGIISGSLRTMNNIHLVVDTEDIGKVMMEDSYKVKTDSSK